MRAVVAIAVTLSTPAALADEAGMRRGLAACFAGLPDFASVNAALSAEGWSSTPGADPGEHELGRGGAAVYVSTGGHSGPGCTAQSATVPVATATALLEAELDRGFGGRWTTAPGYGGSKSWVVAGQGASLGMYVLGGGNSGDGPGSGVSLSVRRDN